MKLTTLNLLKISGRKKAINNIKKIPKIDLIKWLLAQGSHCPPAAEYKAETPTKHNKITQKTIAQLFFKNLEKNISVRDLSENLF
jgi:hypothetical protein